MPLSIVENRFWNALFMVSVRMYVPDTNPTPRTMASAVSPRRTLWASSPLNVARHMPVSVSGERLHAVQDALRRRLGHLVDRPPVVQEDHPVRVAGRGRVVCHHHGRLSELADGPPHERQELRAGARVEVSARL